MENLLTQLSEVGLVDWLGMLTGIIGVYLSIKEKILAWPLFIVCYSCYVYISFRSSYYAFGGMNVLFVILAAYGWFKWKTTAKEGDTKDIQISRLAPRHRWMVSLFICLGTASLGWLLSQTGEARLPYYDAFATTCALTAQWMLSRKHLENWIFWIIADSIWLVFFFNDKIWLSALLFAIFIRLAIKGFFEWKLILKTAKE